MCDRLRLLETYIRGLDKAVTQHTVDRIEIKNNERHINISEHGPPAEEISVISTNTAAAATVDDDERTNKRNVSTGPKRDIPTVNTEPDRGTSNLPIVPQGVWWWCFG